MINTIPLPVVLLTEFCTSKLAALFREFCIDIWWGGAMWSSGGTNYDLHDSEGHQVTQE
jgi:hypothetical protein